MSRIRTSLRSVMLAAVGALGMGAMAQADVPDELYTALGLTRDASPPVLYDALVARYKDPGQGAGKGAFADLWEPTAMSKYFDPLTFYTPPATVKEVNTREECIKCHSEETPGWVRAWKQSPHSDLAAIRNLSPDDPRFYKKAKLEEVEANLRSMGKLGAGERLNEVSCIDCHVDVNTTAKADHTKDLRMPDAAVCGTCHLQEFAERESERDTAIWPDGQWPDGRPSHALDYRANVETGIWAGMAEREIAEGCTGCHDAQNKCDSCHTRHDFSVVEARKPEACQMCHSGIDHMNYENYSASKHGAKYLTLGDDWNWDVPLKDAFVKGGQSAPTCATCHMENNGKYGHNVVRKVRWANYPNVPGVAENLSSDWANARLEAWVKTCNACHSERFARSYFEVIDKATLQGLDKFKQAAAVVSKLYDDGLLPGQKTNRPAPPAPEKDAAASFFQLFWAEGNNPTAPELRLLEMAENHISNLHNSVAHVNYGGWTYTNGWEQVMRDYTEITQADTQLREKADMEARLKALEEAAK